MSRRFCTAAAAGDDAISRRGFLQRAGAAVAASVLAPARVLGDDRRLYPMAPERVKIAKGALQTVSGLEHDLYEGWSQFWSDDYDQAVAGWQALIKKVESGMRAAGANATLDDLAADFGSKRGTEPFDVAWQKYVQANPSFARVNPDDVMIAVRALHGIGSKYWHWGDFATGANIFEQVDRLGYEFSLDRFPGSLLEYLNVQPGVMAKNGRAFMQALERNCVHLAIPDHDGQTLLHVYYLPQEPIGQFLQQNQTGVRNMVDMIDSRYYKGWGRKYLQRFNVVLSMTNGEFYRGILPLISTAPFFSPRKSHNDRMSTFFQGPENMDIRRWLSGHLGHELYGHVWISRVTPGLFITNPLNEGIPECLLYHLDELGGAKTV
jgi:hypothetical protein